MLKSTSPLRQSRPAAPPTPPHVRLPSALLYASDLPPAAVRLWAVLDDACRSAGDVELRRGALAAAVGVSDRQLRRLVAELVAAGYLEVDVAAGRGQTNRYRPLRRARTSGTPMSSFSRSKRDAHVPLSRAAVNGTARDEEPTTDAAAPAPRTWCGRCEDEHSRGSYVDGRFVRCPDCHPALTVRIF